MATDSSEKSTRRKPTKRPASRPKTKADSHYSKLTRKPSSESSQRQRSENAPSTASSPSSRTESRNVPLAHNDVSPQEPTSVDAPQITNYESLSYDSRRRIYGNRDPKRNSSNSVAAALIGLVVVACFILGGFLFWTNRAVRVTLNGEPQKVKVNSSLDEVRSTFDIVTKPGNYVSVGGTVLARNKGYTFSATVDGNELNHQELMAYRVKGGESIEFANGGDRTEAHDTTYREEQPKLVFEGSYGSVSFIKQWGKVGRQEILTGKESGETVDGEWVEPLQDCIVMTKNLAPANDERLVALTFDDGPSAAYTPTCLDILAQYGAKATFFNLSPSEEEYPEIAQRVASEGHQICSHTNQHLQLTTLGGEQMRQEINSAHDVIQRITGVDTTVIRPPYGDFSQESWRQSEGIITASVIWNQDSVDWTIPGADTIVESALANVQPGSIILMHDAGGDREQTMQALPQIIERLQADGYRLVTVAELMAADPDVPDDIANGSAHMPGDAVWPTELAAQE